MMTEEQRAFLARRIHDSAQLQPELLSLRTLLLASGGEEFVPPNEPDTELLSLVATGSLVEGPLSIEPLDEGHCHENVGELWVAPVRTITSIGTGYALSEDGLWRQHSWGMRDDQIVETTSEKIKYFGRILTAEEADRFAAANQGDPEARRWRRLPEIWFRLERDEDCYPQSDWENLKGEPIGPQNTYRILCTPFFANQANYLDEVIASKAHDAGYLAFTAVSKRSGYKTARIWLAEGEDSAAIVDAFVEMDCAVESSSNHAHRLISIAIPSAVLQEVSAYIADQGDSGRWDYEFTYDWVS